VLSLFFMLLGAFFGILEEIVPLVPLMIALSYSLGWDALVGLGMSVLATNIGFSAAITNPFTIGVAQKLAGLPLFSGALLRVPVFLVFYAALAWFLLTYARRIDRDPSASLVYKEAAANAEKYKHLDLSAGAENPRIGKPGWCLVSSLCSFLLCSSPDHSCRASLITRCRWWGCSSS